LSERARRPQISDRRRRASQSRARGGAADLANVRFLPFQPYERLSEFLGSADVHILPQAADAADLVLPSKLGGMLASGKRIVVTAARGPNSRPSSPAPLSSRRQEIAPRSPQRSSRRSMARRKKAAPRAAGSRRAPVEARLPE